MVLDVCSWCDGDGDDGCGWFCLRCDGQGMVEVDSDDFEALDELEEWLDQEAVM